MHQHAPFVLASTSLEDAPNYIPAHLLLSFVEDAPVAGLLCMGWPCGISYGSILGWVNICLPPILMFTRGTLGFDPQPDCIDVIGGQTPVPVNINQSNH